MRGKKWIVGIMMACFVLTLFAGPAVAAKTLKVGVLSIYRSSGQERRRVQGLR
jgi:hypothetical protein